jgi:hypothetical protein
MVAWSLAVGGTQITSSDPPLPAVFAPHRTGLVFVGAGACRATSPIKSDRLA